MHRRGQRWFLSAATCLVACVVAGALAVEKRQHPYTVAEVAQVWIGLSEDEFSYVRLDLRADGTGVGSYINRLREAPVVFPITSWHMSAPKIEICSPLPDGMHDLGTCLNGTVQGRGMTLKAKDKTWERRIWLRKESDLDRWWRQLREAMSDGRQGVLLPR